MQISTTVSQMLTYYLIQSYLLKKINLLHLRHLCFPGKFMNFLEAASGGVLRKKPVKSFTGKLQICNFIKTGLQHWCFSL